MFNVKHAGFLCSGVVRGVGGLGSGLLSCNRPPLQSFWWAVWALRFGADRDRFQVEADWMPLCCKAQVTIDATLVSLPHAF